MGRRRRQHGPNCATLHQFSGNCRRSHAQTIQWLRLRFSVDVWVNPARRRSFNKRHRVWLVERGDIIAVTTRDRGMPHRHGGRGHGGLCGLHHGQIGIPLRNYFRSRSSNGHCHIRFHNHLWFNTRVDCKWRHHSWCIFICNNRQLHRVWFNFDCNWQRRRNVFCHRNTRWRHQLRSMDICCTNCHHSARSKHHFVY